MFKLILCCRVKALPSTLKRHAQCFMGRCFCNQRERERERKKFWMLRASRSLKFSFESHWRRISNWIWHLLSLSLAIPWIISSKKKIWAEHEQWMIKMFIVKTESCHVCQTLKNRSFCLKFRAVDCGAINHFI